MNIVENMAALVGNTPLIRLNHLTKELGAEVCVKAEFYNPLFSVKDRIGKYMIEAAERARFAQTGRAHHRTDFRKHRHRACGAEAGKGRQPADSRNLPLISGREAWCMARDFPFRPENGIQD